jgi:hypothetical protein
MTRLLTFLLLCLSLAGCSTTTEVLVGGNHQTPPIRSAAFVPQGGNSKDMDEHIRHALLARGVDVRATAEPGMRRAPEVDAVVSYSDVWRWDVVMYLQSVDINFFDAQSGSLLVNGRWRNSAMHGFQDPREVVGTVMDGMFAKMGWTASTDKAGATQ